MGKKYFKKKEKDLSAEREKNLTPVAKEMVRIILDAELAIGNYVKNEFDSYNDTALKIIQLKMDNEVKYVDKEFLFQLAYRNEAKTIVDRYMGKIEWKDKTGKDKVIVLNRETVASIVLQPFELIKGLVISSLEKSFNRIIDKVLGMDVLFYTVKDMDLELKKGLAIHKGIVDKLKA